MVLQKLEDIRGNLKRHETKFGAIQTSLEAIRNTQVKAGEDIARLAGKVEGHMETARSEGD